MARRFPNAFPNERTNTGRLHIWRDRYASAMFIVIGRPGEARHLWIGNGIGLRFDLQTRECVGLAVAYDMTDEAPIKLPLEATLTLVVEELSETKQDILVWLNSVG